MNLRPYQTQALDDLWAWFHRHPEGNPIVEAAVGAGKSVMIAALAQRVHAEAPGTRVLVLVHQRELLDQNLAKLKAIWPQADAGVISASHGKRQVKAQIIFATIGSVYKIAHLLGNIGIVLADECHLIQTKEAGMWRSFLRDLFSYCPTTRIVGWTGTPFRGNGVWLTAGDAPLFTHVAAKVTMRQLLDDGYLAPLTTVETATRIDASDVRTSGDDYVLSELAKVTDRDDLVQATCSEIVKVAQHRRRWLVFCVTVEHAQHVTDALRSRGINAGMVTGETPKADRERIISAFRRGELRCLVNVAVLTTGFDAPEVDFIALLRATQSPVLYVQVLGRGMRLADGKTDCLVADFTETIETLGPVDAIKGKLPKPKGNQEAPHKLCPDCGSRNATAALVCVDCGHQFPEPDRVNHNARASAAAILSSQLPAEHTYQVSNVTYRLHQKEGKPDSLRVDYWSGIRMVASEWICFEHGGFAAAKAQSWWHKRTAWIQSDGVPWYSLLWHENKNRPWVDDAVREGCTHIPKTTIQALECIKDAEDHFSKPSAITVRKSGQFTEVVRYHWEATA
jgi:DNA repair protein RadD